MLIFWKPTFERVVLAVKAVESARRAAGDATEPLDILIVPACATGTDRNLLDLNLVENLNAWLDDRPDHLSLVLRADKVAVIDYPLLRRLQNHRWSIALADSCVHLALANTAPSPEQLLELEIRIELARKFRVDVDTLLTVPGENGATREEMPRAAASLLAFLTTNRIRKVSFGVPFLLARLGLPPDEGPVDSRFFATFLEAWLASDRTLGVDDVRSLMIRVVAARNGEATPAALHHTFVDAEAIYPGADGPVPDLRITAPTGTNMEVMEKARDASRRRCAASCGYFPVCGGEHLGAKHLSNGSLDSAQNVYCTGVAMPFFDRVLKLGRPSVGAK